MEQENPHITEIRNTLEAKVQEQLAFALDQIETDLSGMDERSECHRYLGNVYTKLSEMHEEAFYNLIIGKQSKYLQLNERYEGDMMYAGDKYKSIGEAIKDFRAQSGDSQQSLASAIRTSNKTINEWEQGIVGRRSLLNVPNKNVIKRLAAYFNLSDVNREHLENLPINPNIED